MTIVMSSVRSVGPYGLITNFVDPVSVTKLANGTLLVVRSCSQETIANRMQLLKARNNTNKDVIAEYALASKSEGI